MTKQQINFQSAVSFFYENAGYCYGPEQTPEQGRSDCADKLARAEQWLSQQCGHEIEWTEQPEWDTDRSGIEHSAPLYSCLVTVPGIGAESLCGIDLGENPSLSDPYTRVVVAELALELMPK